MHASALADMDELLKRAPAWTKTVLDVGSLNENGTHRPLTDARGWVTTGIDIRPGKNVDIVVPPYDYPFVDGQFDCVISGQAAEHVEDLKLWVNECVRVLKPGGLLAITTVSAMFIHRFPVDTWRIQPDGMEWLFRQNGHLRDYDIRLTAKSDDGGQNIVGSALKT